MGSVHWILLRRIEESKVSYDENGQIHLDVDPIFDVFAMKIISRRRQPAFSSTDPEISSLIEERKQNQPFLEKMQEFKGRLIEDEYTNRLQSLLSPQPHRRIQAQRLRPVFPGGGAFGDRHNRRGPR